MKRLGANERTGNNTPDSRRVYKRQTRCNIDRKMIDFLDTRNDDEDQLILISVELIVVTCTSKTGEK